MGARSIVVLPDNVIRSGVSVTDVGAEVIFNLRSVNDNGYDATITAAPSVTSPTNVPPLVRYCELILLQCSDVSHEEYALSDSSYQLYLTT
jgi:hypothetical protein